MKKSVLFAFLVLAATTSATAQRLERCTMEGFSQIVKTVLTPGFDKAYGMVSNPSFDYMSSIMLYPDKRELVFRKAKDKFAVQSVEDGVPIETSTLTITDEQNNVLTALFDAAVGSARDKEEPKPGELVVVGVDGETFHFFNGRKAGKCWSPPKEDIRGRLVNLMMEISRYVRNHRPLSDQLIEQAQELTSLFIDLQ